MSARVAVDPTGQPPMSPGRPPARPTSRRWRAGSPRGRARWRGEGRGCSLRPPARIGAGNQAGQPGWLRWYARRARVRLKHQFSAAFSALRLRPGRVNVGETCRIILPGSLLDLREGEPMAHALAQFGPDSRQRKSDGIDAPVTEGGKFLAGMS